MILTRDIVPCAPFLYGLLNTLAIKGTGNNYFIKSILNILESLINSSNSDSFNEPDMQFIKSMLAEKKSLSENSVLTFFSNQNDENINKILAVLKISSLGLENTDGIGLIVRILSSLYKLNSNYCKYTAISKHISIISLILSSKKYLNYRVLALNLSVIFYKLSQYREFSVSLSNFEANSLIQILCKIILFPDYEFQDSFPILLGAFCNISAYLLEIHNFTAIELIKVYEYILNKDWLLQKEKNHYCVFYFIEACNNIIQYQ